MEKNEKDFIVSLNLHLVELLSEKRLYDASRRKFFMQKNLKGINKDRSNFKAYLYFKEKMTLSYMRLGTKIPCIHRLIRFVMGILQNLFSLYKKVSLVK